MNKEDIIILAQLLSSMKESSIKLEEAYLENDLVKFKSAKEEFLMLQEEVNKIL